MVQDTFYGITWRSLYTTVRLAVCSTLLLMPLRARSKMTLTLNLICPPPRSSRGIDAKWRRGCKHQSFG